MKRRNNKKYKEEVKYGHENFECTPQWLQDMLMKGHIHYGPEGEEEIYYREYDVICVIEKILNIYNS
jgi:hypothetical protein